MVVKRKIFLALALLFVFFSQLYADQTVDTVVLLDASESMLPYFDSSVDYLIKDIIKNQLNIGDTFHLISFAGKPEFEISKRLLGRKDIEAILSRILLLNPLGKYTDLISALYYVNKYVKKLPLETRKNILILTDGIHDPPPGSEYTNQGNITERIHEITANMIRQGWNVSLVRFPMKNGQDTRSDESGTVDIFTELSKDLGTEIVTYSSDNIVLSHKATGDPLVIFPENLGNIKRNFILPLGIKNFSDKSIQIRLEKVIFEKENILKKPVSISIKKESSFTLKANLELPDSIKSGEHKIPVSLDFSSDSRPYPREGSLTFTLMDSSNSIFNPILFKIFLIIAGAILLTLLLIFTIKRIFEGSPSAYRQKIHDNIHTSGEDRSVFGDTNGNRKNREINSNFIKKSDKQKHIRSIPVKDFNDYHTRGQKAFELIVDNQNRRIGMRNIHWFKDGSKYTIGGSHADDYIIFIHKVDRKIAQVEMEDGKLYLNILKKEYFPDASVSGLKIPMPGNTVRLKLDEKIVNLTLKVWVSPLERINRILHLTDSPGAPDFEY